VAVIIVIIVVMAVVMIRIMMTVVVLLAPFLLALFVPEMLEALVFVCSDVGRVVFHGPDEINLSVARMIFMAVHTPLPCMIRRNMQVERLGDHYLRWWRLDYDRFGINHRRRWTAAQVYATVDAGRDLAMDRYRDIHIGIGRRGRAQRQCCQHSEATGCLHVIPSRKARAKRAVHRR
jgi:hypothetical protein